MSTADKVLKHLEGFELKGHNGQYTSNSPLRPGSNSHGFSVKIMDDEHGAWTDFPTGEKGSLYELATRLGIDTPKREKVIESKRSYTSLSDYADTKGVPEKVFIDAGWEAHTYFDGRPCFKYPTAGGERYRFTDGKKPTFKSVTGYQSNWYGLQRAILLAGKSPLILCNGEPSTIVAQYFGLPAFCMPSGETQEVTPELLTHLKEKWKGSITIALDCDIAGQEGAIKFSEAFKGAAISYTIIDLMLTTHGDLADFCKLHHETLKEDFAKLPRINPTIVRDNKPLDVSDLVKVSRELMAIRKGESGNLEDTLNRLQHEINLLKPNEGKVTTFAQVSSDWKEWVKNNLKHPGIVQGFKTGMGKLDELVGGLDKGVMCGLLAETGMGKTTLIGSITSNLANQAPGLVVPTESRPIDMLNQIIAYRCNIPKHLMRQGRLTPEQAALVFSTAAILEQQKCSVIDCQNPTVEQIILEAERAIKELQIEWIVLDCLSNVKASGSDGIFMTTSEAADCAQELARMNLAVLFTSQVGRSLEGRDNRMPTKHDGKGSGRIEENADVVLGLYNHDNLVKQGIKQPLPEFPSGTIAVRCLKHRQLGEVEGKLIQLKFKGGMGVYD